VCLLCACCDTHAGSSSAALQDRFTYRSFKLGRCKPGQAAATVGSADQLSVGRIEVVIDEVVDTGRRTDTINVQASAHSSTPEQKLSEGKKVRKGGGGG
jgi:hypothetical protein